MLAGRYEGCEPLLQVGKSWCDQGDLREQMLDYSVNHLISRMSDNFLCFVPTDPLFVPNGEAILAAKEMLASLFPLAESIIATEHSDVAFIDAGENWDGVRCPMCKSDMEAWWNDAMSEAYKRKFSNLIVRTQCCEKSVSLNKLAYVWPVAFAKFVLEVMNPNVIRIEEKGLTRLSQILGCEIKEIIARV